MVKSINSRQELAILSIEGKEGVCRICGKMGALSLEHIIPKAAGGGMKTKLYDMTDLLENKKNAFGKIRQNGITARTICRECNSRLGRWFDRSFSKFYSAINIMVDDNVKNLIDIGEIKVKSELNDKSLKFRLKGIQPFYIAKRILAMFCSVDFPGLSDQIPEIRKALLQKDYIPDASDFALFLCLHCGNGAFFSTIATLKLPDIIDCYAGVESLYLGFYLKRKNNNEKNLDTLGNCLNITDWLTDCEPKKEYAMDFILPFSTTMVLNIPIPE